MKRDFEYEERRRNNLLQVIELINGVEGEFLHARTILDSQAIGDDAKNRFNTMFEKIDETLFFKIKDSLENLVENSKTADSVLEDLESSIEKGLKLDGK